MFDEKKMIILIDDDSICNSVNQLLIKKEFDHELAIQAFDNPSEALEFLTDSIKSKVFEKILVLLDINMPGMTGWELLKEYGLLEKNETEVDIFILSSSINQEDMDKAADDSNVIGFMSKPISNENVRKLYKGMNWDIFPPMMVS